MRFLTRLLIALVLLSRAASAEVLKLKNGAELIVEADSRSPREILDLNFLGGAGQLKPSEQGLTQVLTQILNEGPEGIPNEEFKKQLFLLGARMDFGIDARSASVTVTAPKENLDKALALALATLQKPKFDKETYNAAFGKVKANIAHFEDDMGTVLRYYASRDAFANHPDVLDGNTTSNSLKNVSLEKVKAVLPKLFDPAYLLAAAVGTSQGAEIQTLLNTSLGDAGLLKSPAKQRAFSSAKEDKKRGSHPKIVLVNRTGATDNQIRYLVRRNIPIDNSDFVALELANKLLGDGMQSSLFRVLREQRGLTYSAGSGLNENVGVWVVVSFATTDKLGKLMSGIEEVVNEQAKVVVDKNAADLIKLDELTKWKEGRELPADRLSESIGARIYGRDLAFEQGKDAWIEKATEADITRMGKEYFTLKEAYIYVMGDKTKLLPVFKGLGYKTSDVKVVDEHSIP